MIKKLIFEVEGADDMDSGCVSEILAEIDTHCTIVAFKEEDHTGQVFDLTWMKEFVTPLKEGRHC